MCSFVRPLPTNYCRPCWPTLAYKKFAEVRHNVQVSTCATLLPGAVMSLRHHSYTSICISGYTCGMTINRATQRREQVRLMSSGENNNCTVGSFSHSNPTGTSLGVNAVSFGSVRRREARRSERQIRNRAALESLSRLERIVAKPSAEEEQKAKELLKDTYGFVSKPPSCLYYRQFLSELRRYEMEWRMGSVRTTVFSFTMTDYGIDGKGLEPVQMCLLRGEQSKTTSFAHMLAGVKQLFQMNPSEFEVPFMDEFSLKHTLVLRTVFPIGISAVSTDDEDPIAKSDCQLAAERELEQEMEKPFIGAPGGPYHRYLQRVEIDLVNGQSGSVKPLIRNMSIQAFSHCFIMSVTRFVKRKEIEGKTNIEFMGSDHLEELRFAFVFLRSQIGLSIIDELELNEMLPPPTGNMSR
eukprot:Tbor_TRINITY_DN2309_c0_g2::TRINITY_DN2309_c0_g2_i1::g.157::m.157